MPALAFSHNPDGLVEWIWVVLAYGIVAVIVAVAVALVVRALGARSARDDRRTRR